MLDAVRSTWISSTGAYIDRFEREWASFTGARHALTVSNGTVAIHLALLGLDVGPGDEVIVPSLTYIATANAVRYVGAEPVFVDVDPATWCIDPRAVEAAVTPRTKAVIPVHLYGHPADMDAIVEIARRHNMAVIEDAAEAHGATYKGRPVGSLGDVATFSFFGNKILTSGEGGAVTFSDGAMLDRYRMLRGQGMDPNRRYFFPIVGHNFRLTNVAAALLCAQFERQAEIVARRLEVFDGYRRRLAGVPGLSLQPIHPDVTAAPWLFCLRVDPQTFGVDRDRLMAVLAEAGVETRPFFIPLHRLPPYLNDQGQLTVSLPHTDRIASSGLNLPTNASLSEQQLDLICQLVIGARDHA